MRIRNRVWSGKMRDESLSSCKNPCELRSQEEEEEEEEEEGKSNDNGDGDGDRDGAQFLMPLVVAALDAQSHLQEDEQHGELIKNSSSSSCARAAVNPKKSWRDLLLRSSSQVNRESSRGGTIIGKKRTANHREGMAAITETEAKGEEGEDNGEYSKASSDPKKNKEGIKAAAAADEDDYFNSSAAAKLRADQWRRREVRRQKQKKNGECEAENEATRCKRRNGKGWRCSATRVDGYSLCQHHLNGTPAWKRLRNLKAETAAEAEAEAAPASASAPTTATTTNVNVNVNVTVTVTGTGTVKQQPQTKKHKKQQQQTNETTTTVVNEDKMNKKKKKKERSLKDINTVLDHYHQ